MKLSIQLHLSGLSLLNTVRVCEVFGVERARSTVHKWVHKADLQPGSGKNPDHEHSRCKLRVTERTTISGTKSMEIGMLLKLSSDR